MREHRFVVHPSAASIVREFFADPDGIRPGSQTEGKSQDAVLRRVRKNGKWAFVDVSPDPTADCIVHLWFFRDMPMHEIAIMIAHELGHIADGGPHSYLSHDEEETRADEYARATSETLTLLGQLGLLP